MEITTSARIITKQVLNENSGELEQVEFQEVKKTSKLRGGFKMMYDPYNVVMEQVVKSNKDIKVFNWITSQFTYQRVETSLSYLDCSIEVSKPQFTKMIGKLVELDYLRRVKRGIYRLNPYMYLPFRSNGAELQKEWNELSTKSKEFTDLEKRVKEFSKQSSKSDKSKSIKIEVKKEEVKKMPFIKINRTDVIESSLEEKICS
jgi:hypothetical protein